VASYNNRVGDIHATGPLAGGRTGPMRHLVDMPWRELLLAAAFAAGCGGDDDDGGEDDAGASTKDAAVADARAA
jgi:hypothetical protein